MKFLIQEQMLGKKGEDLAVSLLQNKGYRILETNYRIKIGEIDIVAYDDGTYCFVEVKTRKTKSRGLALESIAAAKQRKLCRVAQWYISSHDLFDAKARFDVVAIQVERDGSFEVSLIKNAFECPNN